MTELLDSLARELFERLTSGDPDRLHPLRARDEQIVDLFALGFSDAVLDQRRADDGGAERASRQWGLFQGSRYVGFCARRIGTGVSDLPGLSEEVKVVGELVLAGRDAAGDWAGAVRDIVQTQAGYRLVRWSIEAPRRNHFDLESWTCDFSRRQR